MTQQFMTPTFPTTTWSPLRQTFWTESPWGPLPSPQLLSAAVHCTGARPGLRACVDQVSLCGQAPLSYLHREAWCFVSGAVEVSRVRANPTISNNQGPGSRSPHCTLACVCIPGTLPVCGGAISACRTSQCKGRRPRPCWVSPLLRLLPGRSLSTGPVTQGQLPPPSCHPQRDKRTEQST